MKRWNKSKREKLLNMRQHHHHDDKHHHHQDTHHHHHEREKKANHFLEELKEMREDPKKHKFKQ